MTPAQIDELNKKNRTRSYDLKDVNGAPFTFLPTIVYKDSTLGIQFHLMDPLSLKSFRRTASASGSSGIAIRSTSPTSMTAVRSSSTRGRFVKSTTASI